MDFFTLQDKARTQTRWLAFLFILAVILIILCINLVAYFAFASQTSEGISINQWLTQPYWLIVTLAIVTVIGFTSLWRSWQLKSTPDAVAKMVNATPVSLNSQVPLEKRLINVVEEMSLASGVPMPHIFIMQDEHGINAFVAGLDTSSITLVVTQGLLENLTRQELQGVIAHEYSHVFHGDMKINVKLIGILAGILVIGQLGELLFRVRSHSRNSKDNGGGAIVLIGVGIFVIGYIGLFFGRLIKAGISRQREFLADASAIQYTRDPDGISGALYKIAKLQQGSQLNAAKAEEVSHLCFGQSVKQSFSGLFATHPPLNKRIEAINPKFYSEKAGLLDAQSKQDAQQVTNDDSHFSNLHSTSTSNEFDNLSQTITTQSALNSVGTVSEKQVSHTQRLIDSIPEFLVNVAKDREATAKPDDLILSLLLDTKQKTNQLEFDLQQLTEDKRKPVSLLLELLTNLNFKQQHLLLGMALARIESQDAQSNRALVMQLSRLVNQTNKPNLSEFMIYAATARRALPQSTKVSSIGKFTKISQEIDLFLSVLYQHCQLPQTQKEQQLARHRQLLGITQTTTANNSDHLESLARALHKIGQLHPLLKKEFIQISLEIVENDQEINQAEYELLRLLGEYLSCPFPITIE